MIRHRLTAFWLRLHRNERGGIDSLVYIVTGLLFAAGIYAFFSRTALPTVIQWLTDVIDAITAIK